MSPVPDVDTKPYLLYVTWAPRGNGLVMVYNNDIFYRPSPRSDKNYRVTTTGVPGVISNGVPDWLYEGTLPAITLSAFKNRVLVIVQPLSITGFSFNRARLATILMNELNTNVGVC